MADAGTGGNKDASGMTGQQKLVSVIIPVYNSRDFIIETLESVTAQTYRRIEVIVVDDGSSDDTGRVVLDYVNRLNGSTGSYDNITIKLLDNKKKKGAAGARNTGIDEAGGDYITFIDADDKWLPDKIEKQLIFMKQIWKLLRRLCLCLVHTRIRMLLITVLVLDLLHGEII